MSAPVAPTIIIIKKKSAHAGHHGGAWKVAYADFVTAMMALFIVLWLLSASVDIQKSVAGYFRDPKGFGKRIANDLGGVGKTLVVTKTNLNELKNKLQEAIKQSPELDKIKNHVQFTITGDGLRIELMESEKGTFFESGQAIPTPAARDLLEQLAHQFGSMENTILIEGHTDAKAYDSQIYSNWELSADRANAVRRIMQEKGLRGNQVTEIRGYADQQLQLPDKPNDPSNRRVSVIVQYLHRPNVEEPPSGKSEGEEHKTANPEGKAAHK